MPPAWFFTQMENGIKLAAAGKVDEEFDFDGRRYRVGEIMEHYELDEFIERAKFSDDEYKERHLQPDWPPGEMPF